MNVRMLPALSGAIAALSLSGAAETNLVRGLPYTYWPEPEYYFCSDEQDGIQLTDGETQYAGGMWMNRSCVGWAAGIDVPAVTHFDLGAASTLEELVFNTCGGGGAGVVEVGLRVLVSLDDQSYVTAAEHVAPSPAAGASARVGIQLKVPLNGVRARYVAVAAMPPAPHYFVFVDEIEVIGTRPADPASNLPVQGAVFASGGREIQEILAGSRRAVKLLKFLTAPVERHVTCWPRRQAEEQRQDLAAARQRTLANPDDYDAIRAALTAAHRDRARQVYGADTLVWETFPDAECTMLSLPTALAPPRAAAVHTAINALEATALGVANLSGIAQPLGVRVTGVRGRSGAPTVTPRIARFFETTNARYVPDALLATDCPQAIPSGESRLVWIGVESTGAAAGTHEFLVTVTVGDKVHSIPLTVHVLDVTLSADTPLSTGNWSYLNTGEQALFAEVRESMLSHRITMGAASAQAFPKKDAAGNLVRPLEIDFTDLDKFLEFHKDFPQVSWFYPFDPHTARPHYDWFGPAKWMSAEFKDIFSEWLVKVVEHIKSKGRDYDSFYFHLFDETLDNKVAELCRLVHAVDPEVRLQCTIPQASLEAISHFVSAGMNIFNYHAPRLTYDNAPNGFPTLRSGGRELWFYGAAGARFGDGKERDPLGFFRYLHWTAVHYGATGVHFWNMLHNSRLSPIWEPETVEHYYWPMVYPIGPGYPEPPTDVRTAETVVPSRRWEYVRMGIEDAMLLHLAKERIAALGEAGAAHRDELQQIVKAVITNRDTDRGLFRTKRRELLVLVETLAAD